MTFQLPWKSQAESVITCRNLIFYHDFLASNLKEKTPLQQDKWGLKKHRILQTAKLKKY